VAGGSSTSYRIRVSPESCSAYSSFVGLDAAEPPTKWGDRLSLELQWVMPREPLCRTQEKNSMFVAGGSSTSYRIRVSSKFCSAYSSFVGLNAMEPPATWGDRLGLELLWAMPREPLCRTQSKNTVVPSA
jgi:hypothetical protein